ncbi:nucleolar protein 11 [Sitophilus oryzae]|uniref:Nucleolar protein 11 n=1 Tax=Sitophilus oryzae TaxID=7048 RepID=A0A6J2XEK1_SITOR|nr:nucleolar protein 11 [Sitophilus oryzae]
MAKLLSYYRLCPLIDSKSLLGISHDSEKGFVIVTLGRNIVIKYRLSDQKQICSWRTRDKFSSQVLYDKRLEKYVGVFNISFLRIWSNDDENIDKIKKIKFTQQIHSILSHNEETYIFFKDGSLYSLREILENKKNFVPEKFLVDESVHNILYTSVGETLYFGYLIKRRDKYIFHWSKYTNNSKNNFNAMPIQRDRLDLKGYGLHVEKNLVIFLSVWSDGRIYAQHLKDKENYVNSSELFTVIEPISTTHLVKMIDIDENYIGVYGADPNEEGAILLIYNTQFKVNQSKQNHKLYTNDSKIWRIDENIFLPVGQNLVVVPFCLESEQLAALIGSHKPLPSKPDSDVIFVMDFEVGSWQDKIKLGNKLVRKKSLKFSEHKVQEYFKQGLPESLIIEQILPNVLEESNIKLLGESLDFFTDIPEKYLSLILNFILSRDEGEFSPKNKTLALQNLPEELLPLERVALLDKLLIRKYSDVLLLPYLRSDLHLEQAICLLKYITYMLSENGHNLPKLNAVKTEQQIINWASLIIDSNYQKFVLSRDSNIENILVECKNRVTSYLDIVEELKQISPALYRISEEIKGKNCNVGFNNSLYLVEQVSFY